MLFFKILYHFSQIRKISPSFKCRAKGRLVNKILLARNEHVIDIFTSEDMENILLCIFRYLTAYYIINIQYYKTEIFGELQFFGGGRIVFCQSILPYTVCTIYISTDYA